MLQDILMVLMTVLIMGGAIIFIKKTNPANRRRITYYSTKDVFEKKICTKCGVKMKKTWNKEVDNPNDIVFPSNEKNLEEIIELAKELSIKIFPIAEY